MPLSFGPREARRIPIIQVDLQTLNILDFLDRPSKVGPFLLPPVHRRLGIQMAPRIASRKGPRSSSKPPQRFEAGPARATLLGDTNIYDDEPAKKQCQHKRQRSKSRPRKSPGTAKSKAESDSGKAVESKRSMKWPIFAFAICCILFVLILVTQHEEDSVTTNSAKSASKNGFWGCPEDGPDGKPSPHCSNIDWCEDNYVYSPAVAEIFNTASSAIYVVFATFGTWAYFCYPVDRWAVGIGERRLCVCGS